MPLDERGVNRTLDSVNPFGLTRICLRRSLVATTEWAGERTKQRPLKGRFLLGMRGSMPADVCPFRPSCEGIYVSPFVRYLLLPVISDSSRRAWSSAKSYPHPI